MLPKSRRKGSRMEMLIRRIIPLPSLKVQRRRRRRTRLQKRQRRLRTSPTPQMLQTDKRKLVEPKKMHQLLTWKRGLKRLHPLRRRSRIKRWMLLQELLLWKLLPGVKDSLLQRRKRRIITTSSRYGKHFRDYDLYREWRCDFIALLINLELLPRVPSHFMIRDELWYDVTWPRWFCFIELVSIWHHFCF